MSRPKNKSELKSLSNSNFLALIEYVDALPKTNLHQQFPAKYLNRNIRDVLGHLHEWHLMFLKWYEVGMNGDKPDIPAKGFTWKTTPQLNMEIRQKFSTTDLEVIRKLLEESHQKVQKIISSHSEKELFEKKRYKWTGSTSLGAYLIGATSSHYAWALKLIRKASK